MSQLAQTASPEQPAQPAPPAEAPRPAGELILHQARLHWAVYVRPVMLSSLAVLLFGNGQPLIGAAAALGAGLLWAAALMAAGGAVYVITERRVRIRAGSVYRVSLDLPLDRVESVSVRQDTMGRLLGYGTLRIDGGDGSRAVCPGVAGAVEFSRRLESLRAPA